MLNPTNAVKTAACALFACMLSDRALAQLEVVGPAPSGYRAVFGSCGDPQCDIVLGTMSNAVPAQPAHAFRWTSSAGMTDLAVASGTPIETVILSRDGTTYMGVSDPSGLAHTYRWQPPSPAQDVGYLEGMTRALGWAISADGKTIAGVMSNTPGGFGSRGFIWTAESGVVDMNLPPVTSWVNIAWISGDGSTVIGDLKTNNDTYLVFRWTVDTGPVYLPKIPAAREALSSCATPDGAHIVGVSRYSASTQFDRLAIWTNDVPSEYGLPPTGYQYMVPLAVSADGKVVVGQLGNNSGDIQGFIWKKNMGIRVAEEYLRAIGVDFTGWGHVRDVTGISDDGRTLVGYGTAGSNVSSTWRLRNTVPPPCEGDFNGDGQVNTTDLAALLAAFGTCPGNAAYLMHLNIEEEDPCINTADLVLFLGRFGRPCE